MTAEWAIEEIIKKADPRQATCLRCCAGIRLIAIGFAKFDPSKGGPTINITDEDIDREVSAILRAHPDLAGRYRGYGCPVRVPCRPEPASRYEAWSRPVQTAGFPGVSP